ncbi:AbrB/MazE/SpoVT family DNA-binding domain-containing protein [Fusobacterium sp.]|uniref:AbrB/MazE/SpoVT family DNA-binding domain-containing protein n=1 Tax=Fusobacterium sp. TaxID=68766 RepID=UPI00262AD6DA|nr:AbrB/MazE/SpoVT family DNA-binding domain-containing protein [Fusobacterium sp.]
MEKRELNVSFAKAGNGKNARVIIPIPWLRKLNITEEEKEIDLIFDENNQQLIIKKRK